MFWARETLRYTNATKAHESREVDAFLSCVSRSFAPFAVQRFHNTRPTTLTLAQSESFGIRGQLAPIAIPPRAGAFQPWGIACFVAATGGRAAQPASPMPATVVAFRMVAPHVKALPARAHLQSWKVCYTDKIHYRVYTLKARHGTI